MGNCSRAAIGALPDRLLCWTAVPASEEEGEVTMFKKILLPVDLADPEHYKAALSEARELARLHNADVRVVTVLELPPPPTVGYQTQYMPDEVRQNALDSAEREAQEVARQLKVEGRSADVSVRSGRVYHEVLEEAKNWGADLIVMGSHHPGMRTYLLGSNAARIARHAACSVLILRTAAD